MKKSWEIMRSQWELGGGHRRSWEVSEGSWELSGRLTLFDSGRGAIFAPHHHVFAYTHVCMRIAYTRADFL